MLGSLVNMHLSWPKKNTYLSNIVISKNILHNPMNILFVIFHYLSNLIPSGHVDDTESYKTILMSSVLF